MFRSEHDTAAGELAPRSVGVRSVERSPEELALEAHAGSCDAFGMLVARFQRSLYTFLLVRTRSREDAEELTQEAFLMAWRKIDRYRPRFKFSTWLFALARRLALSHARRRKSTTSLDDASLEIAKHGADPFGEACASEERAMLWRTAASVLTEEQRSALWLRYAEDLSIEEIARVLGKLQTSVRVLLFRAREKLAEELQRKRSLASMSTSDLKADGRHPRAAEL